MSGIALCSWAATIVFGLLLWAAPVPAAAADPDGDDAPKLLGDHDGWRSGLKKYGITPAVVDINEVLGNLGGGVRRGVIYEGRTDLSLAVDLRPQFQWPGDFFVRAYQVRGRGLTPDIANLNTISNIEATATTRLFELWYEQQIGDWLHVRLGRQAADQEFLIADGAKLFINATFGFPTLPAVSLPSGGPAYPLATPAVRLRVDVNEELTFFAGVFNGDPAGPGTGDPQKRDPSGTRFSFSDGLFTIYEARYNPGKTTKNGTYRVGAWYHTEPFADQRIDTTGLSLASPLSSGTPRRHSGNGSIYASVDQPLFGGDDKSGFAAFARVMTAPDDRNLLDFYVDGGITYKNPEKNLFGRTGDTFGLAIAYANIGKSARALAIDQTILAGMPVPRRTGETLIELTWQIAIADGVQLQPDLQYVINPGGGIANPLAPASRVGNALIAGLRSTIDF